MQLEQGKFCPLIGEDCLGLKCTWFTQVRGTNPQTGKDVDEWGCAVTWMPMLLIENSQQQRSTSSAVESFRNETVRVGHMLMQPRETKVLNDNSEPINIDKLDSHKQYQNMNTTVVIVPEDRTIGIGSTTLVGVTTDLSLIHI